jgi:hypothetical protein
MERYSRSPIKSGKKKATGQSPAIRNLYFKQTGMVSKFEQMSIGENKNDDLTIYSKFSSQRESKKQVRGSSSQSRQRTNKSSSRQS